MEIMEETLSTKQGQCGTQRRGEAGEQKEHSETTTHGYVTDEQLWLIERFSTN